MKKINYYNNLKHVLLETEEVYFKSKGYDFLSCFCSYCKNTFKRKKEALNSSAKIGTKNFFCNKTCEVSSRKLTTEEFINRSNKIHNNKYKYLSDWLCNTIKVKIECPIHRYFLSNA